MFFNIFKSLKETNSQNHQESHFKAMLILVV